ncbi:hypothetical protein vseg_009315 [Gypsophila vaccaria]
MSTTDVAVTVPLLVGESSRQPRRRMMSEQSLRVRQTAARQIEEQRGRLAYSTPVVIIDLIWNTAIVLITFAVYELSKDEVTEVPLRSWIVGYCVLCGFHMVCVCVEYRRRRREAVRGGTVASILDNSSLSLSLGESNLSSNSLSSSSRSSLGADFADYAVRQRREDEGDDSTANLLESANKILSFFWWILGFYWISSGGETMADNAPKLYWLTTTFLILDVIVVVICVVVACIIGIAVCCCLPVIIAIMYTVTDQEGASTEEIEKLRRYRFRKPGEGQESNREIEQLEDGGVMIECGTDTPIEKPLPAADAACSICIEDYEDESEIRELPCRHLFHCACVDKWLRTKPTCPLCKNNILETDVHSNGEV